MPQSVEALHFIRMKAVGHQSLKIPLPVLFDIDANRTLGAESDGDVVAAVADTAEKRVARNPGLSGSQSFN